MLPVSRANRRPAFTLIELLVVIGIIAVLISILIPVVGKMRTTAYTTRTQAFIAELDGAIQRYHADFHAYPGPVPNDECGYNKSGANADTITSLQTGRDLNRNMTGTENLVLGLLGGVYRDTKGDTDPTNDVFMFDIQRTLSAKGPSSVGVGLPKTYPAYVEAKQLFTAPDPNDPTKTNGFYRDEAGSPVNTEIPEFVDNYASPMPILYMRANVGVGVPPGPLTATNNPIITPAPTGNVPPNPPAQYDLRHIIAYTGPDAQGRYIGEGKRITASKYKGGPMPPAHGLQTVDPTASMDKSATKYVYPFDAYPYFTNPNSPNTPRQKDGFVLISAGPDRIYGTEDDICNFGSVLP